MVAYILNPNDRLGFKPVSVPYNKKVFYLLKKCYI